MPEKADLSQDPLSIGTPCETSKKLLGMDSILIIFLDRINQSSLKLRPGTQNHQEFFAGGEGLSAEGRHYPNDPVNPVQIIFY